VRFARTVEGPALFIKAQLSIWLCGFVSSPACGAPAGAAAICLAP
jgi:hypothetical protein